nr:hypothetical protein [Tanacetum cinerariifolium]
MPNKASKEVTMEHIYKEFNAFKVSVLAIPEQFHCPNLIQVEIDQVFQRKLHKKLKDLVIGFSDIVLAFLALVLAFLDISSPYVVPVPSLLAASFVVVP